MASNTQPRDMRTWIADLEGANELIHIDKPVDPLTEMESLLYQSREKALLFENLPHGWRSLGQARQRAPCRPRLWHQ
jgi:UbiD family decarboxylase